jgi:hypothetical protein
MIHNRNQRRVKIGAPAARCCVRAAAGYIRIDTWLQLRTNSPCNSRATCYLMGSYVGSGGGFVGLGGLGWVFLSPGLT